MVSVKNVSKIYENKKAVDDISFDVEEGTILGFLGPNGAGKSTTMNMITGYISATEGNIFIDGVDMFDKPELAKSKIGYLPEIPPLYNDMTVKEYLMFVADLKKVSKKEREEKVRLVMGETGSDKVADRLIKHISKGYKQRVGIAQALLGDPKVIILDEPTVGLDPVQIIEIRELIKSLKKDHTVIFSSHILSEVSEVCDRILVIDEGKIIRMDNTEDLLNEFSDEEGIKVIVKCNSEAGKEVFSSIEGISDVTVISEEENQTEFRIRCDREDIKDEITFAFAGQRIAVSEITQIKVNLEEAFLEILKSRKEGK